VLDSLINHEGRTRLTLKTDKQGRIAFRGFRGKYKITYKNRKGKTVTIDYEP
jgi:hypothetical protein